MFTGEGRERLVAARQAAVRWAAEKKGAEPSADELRFARDKCFSSPVIIIVSMVGDDNKITDQENYAACWCAIENLLLAGTAHNEHQASVARAGVIGFRLPALRIDSVPVKAFDTLIMATDGIQPDFAEALSLDGRPQRIADSILSHHRKPNDDALVLVARYLGGDGL